MNWFLRMTGIEQGIVVAIVMLLVAAVFMARDEAKQKVAFMAECTQDRKQYECDSMWKAMHPAPTHIIVQHY